ncbi:MAG: VanW family protein [Bacillota bacterium]
MTGRRLLLLVLSGLAALLLTVTGTFWGIVTVEGRSQTVFPGVSVYGLDLGGLDQAGCLEAVGSLEQSLRRTPLTLVYGSRSWRVELGDLGLVVDGDKITSEALKAGRSGFFVSQWLERGEISRNGFKLDLCADFEEPRFHTVIDEITTEITRAPVDARYHIGNDDTVHIIPHQDGYQVDHGRLKQRILQQLETGRLAPVSIPVVHVVPEYTTSDVEAMNLTGLLAEFGTDYDPAVVNRSYNISVAAGALNNLLIPPGEIVSFNRIVGPRSSEAGYRTAPVIIENQFQEGIGGGVCQVSSTLYNAVVLANLEVLERKNHSLPVTYVPIGRDATVVFGAIDFRFRNNTGGYIYLKTSAANGRVSVKIFGDHRYHPRVEIKSWITETLEPRTVYEDDENLEKGKQVVKQAGLRGYRAQAERWVWQNGETEKEPLPSSFYHPVPEIIAVGTREPVPALIVPPESGVPIWIPDPGNPLLPPGSIPPQEESGPPDPA